MIIMGLVDGIVSLQVEDERCLSSLFWASMGVGVVLTLGTIVTAAPLANFMDTPRLENMLYWFSSIPVLVALSALPNLLILKDMDIKIYALRTIVATIVGGGVGIAMAYMDFGAYAIVGQQVSFFIITNIVVWLSISWRPKLIFDKKSLIEVVRPGLGYMGVSVLTFLDGQAPRFIVGKILGTTSLGYYAFVTRLQYSITETLISPPLTILFPALSQLGHDKEAQRQMTANLLFLYALVLFPILSVAAATSPIYVPLFFGDNWLSAVPLLQIFIVGTAIFPIRNTLIQLVRSNSMMHHLLIPRVILLLLSLASSGFLFLENGLFWMCLSINLIPFFAQPYYLVILKRTMGVSLWHAHIRLWPTVLAAALCYFGIYYSLKENIFSTNPWLCLIEALFSGMGIYLVSLIALQYKQVRMILPFVQNILNQRGKRSAQ